MNQSQHVSRYNSPFNYDGVANQFAADFIAGNYSAHVEQYNAHQEFLLFVYRTAQVHKKSIEESIKLLGFNAHDSSNCSICQGS